MKKKITRLKKCENDSLTSTVIYTIVFKKFICFQYFIFNSSDHNILEHLKYTFFFIIRI